MHLDFRHSTGGRCGCNDLSLQGHDLRGAEKNLQLYHQLSGRAGRTGKPATVYFQTYNTNTKMISDLRSN